MQFSLSLNLVKQNFSWAAKNEVIYETLERIKFSLFSLFFCLVSFFCNFFPTILDVFYVLIENCLQPKRYSQKCHKLRKKTENDGKLKVIHGIYHRETRFHLSFLRCAWHVQHNLQQNSFCQRKSALVSNTHLCSLGISVPFPSHQRQHQPASHNKPDIQLV